MHDLLELYLAFLKIGAVNFGGGYAMLPLLERDLVTKRGWTTTDDLMDYFAIGQCTPGIIALNVSTFIGHKRRGIPGAIAATLGFLTIPIIIILVIAAFLTNFAELPVVQHAFAGIRVCVCILILYLVVFCLTMASRFLPFSIPAAVLVILSGFFGFFLYREKAEVISTEKVEVNSAEKEKEAKN